MPLESLSKQDKICFVCTANICRSAFAEFYMKKQLKERNVDSIRVTSCGVQTRGNIPTTSDIIEIAREFDVEMSAHTSRTMERELLSDCRLVLGMEKFHCDEVGTRFPETKGRVFLLRNFAREGSSTRGIADPFGLSADFVRSCFDDIAEGVEGLLTTLLES